MSTVFISYRRENSPAPFTKFRPIRQPCGAAKRISSATPSLLVDDLG
jgi:hypothetical protein